MDEKQFLFVYGTLKRGERNHHLLRGQPFVAAALTQPRYRLYDQGWYPCLIQRDPGVPVAGEVYLVDEAVLQHLDVLEDAPALYRRTSIDLQEFGHPVLSYVYQKSVENFADLGGCWTAKSD